MQSKNKTKRTTVWLCTTAMLMAVNVAMSSFGVPVPGGHLYMNDIVICLAAIMLDPFAAFMVGGVGAFLGDLFFYPLPMFVSLVTHGLQAVVISVFSHYVFFASIHNNTYLNICNHFCPYAQNVCPYPFATSSTKAILIASEIVKLILFTDSSISFGVTNIVLSPGDSNSLISSYFSASFNSFMEFPIRFHSGFSLNAVKRVDMVSFTMVAASTTVGIPIASTGTPRLFSLIP